MKDMGVDKHTIKAVVSTYEKTSTRIQMGNISSENSKLVNGIKQGSVLSPVLFIIYVNDLIEELQKMNVGLNIDINDKRMTIPCLMFVDDIILLAKHVKDLDRLICKLNEEFVKMFAISF